VLNCIKSMTLIDWTITAIVLAIVFEPLVRLLAT
jgi:hypothetical protein